MGTMSTFSGITYRIYLEVSFHSKTVQVLQKQCRRTYQSYASASIVHCYKGFIYIGFQSCKVLDYSPVISFMISQVCQYTFLSIFSFV